MRRGSGVALTALLLSLLFHAALLAGIWGWGPISLDPVDAPVVEARLLVDPPPAPVAPALPQKALTPASAIPPALPPPRATQAVVDVPEANVAIIMSGSGSVREHVQRLGRILRLGEDKRATLYELVAAGTAEQHTSERRREHNAYR